MQVACRPLDCPEPDEAAPAIIPDSYNAQRTRNQNQCLLPRQVSRAWKIPKGCFETGPSHQTCREIMTDDARCRAGAQCRHHNLSSGEGWTFHAEGHDPQALLWPRWVVVALVGGRSALRCPTLQAGHPLSPGSRQATLRHFVPTRRPPTASHHKHPEVRQHHGTCDTVRNRVTVVALSSNRPSDNGREGIIIPSFKRVIWFSSKAKRKQK